MQVLSSSTSLANAWFPGAGAMPLTRKHSRRVCAQNSRRDAVEFDLRSWGRKLGASGLPVAVEAILLDEALAADESVASDPVVAFSNDYSIYLFTAVVVSGILFIAGVIFVAVTDFTDKQQTEELNKQAERREKRLAARGAKKKSKGETINSRPAPKGFGKSKEEELVE